MSINRFDDKIIIKGLPIADITFNRLPYLYFLEVCRKINLKSDFELIFCDILDKNIGLRKKLLNTIKSIESTAAQTLRETINIEINMIKSSQLFQE